MEKCKCLCAVNHPPHLGICKGEARGTLRFSKFPPDSPLRGFDHIDVEMCSSCKIATLTKRIEKEG